jgi:DNA polymerase V
METAIALVDCQNFYCSCERVFDPSLRHRPVAVLSNNDGCVIARSEEVKEAGVEMGAPYFEAEGLLRHIGAEVFSSNYALYGDMSRRVRAVLKRFAAELEAYSIDECFLTLPRMERGRVRRAGERIRGAVRRLVGVPVRVGIGRTKTLAKLASYEAKENLRAGLGGGVFVEPGEREGQVAFLERVPAGEVWGIGSAYEEKLARHGVENAFHVGSLPQEWAREHLTMTGLRTVLELRGQRCLEVEKAPSPKKTLTRSRSFSRPVRDLKEIKEAVAAHVSRAAEKLREARLVARGLRVFATTKAFGPGPHHANAAGGTLAEATAYAPTLAKAARQGAEAICREGYGYEKAGVTLYELAPEEPEQPSLFSGATGSQRKQTLMAAMDRINSEHGKRAVQLASAGLEQPWRMKRGRRSARYTTRWSELPVAEA